jgi:ABC-2 type transport system ATP-binding protein
MIRASRLAYRLPDGRQTLHEVDFHLPRGGFLAVLGENGAGKTTLLDLLMGFRRRTGGTLEVLEGDPDRDPWGTRSRIAYLSEKVDLPGQWSGHDFLRFNERFYARYDRADEERLTRRFAVGLDARVGNLSAGELRRLQLVGALAGQPDLVVADEITALLDIVGRRMFLSVLKDRQRHAGLTVVLATNIPEGLDGIADHVLLIHRGRQLEFAVASRFATGEPSLAEAVVRRLTTDAEPLR